jgi:DNA-binding NarL/FixJ family response regulator
MSASGPRHRFAPIRVVLADDHAVVRQGLRTFLDLQDDIEVVAEASDGHEAVNAASAFDPDVVLLDLVMPGLDGLGALKQLRSGRARVIVLTSFGDDDKLFAALRGGAAGYLLKDVQPADLVRAIRSAYAGESPLSPAIATRVVEEVAQGAVSAHDDLTPRELDVLTLIARGRSNKVIARELGVAEKTVKTHVSHILAKLGVADRTQAALYAVKQGL